MKNVLIWFAVLSAAIAAIIALVPLIPFILGLLGVVICWRLIVYTIAGR